jgi:hypothetical protein
MRRAFRMYILLGICVSCAAQGSSPTTSNQPLRAVPELVTQRYCYGDAEVFSVLLKLRTKYQNRTGESIILDKEIGKAWYREIVAQDTNDLLNGKYEYHPITDWFFSDKDPQPVRPNPNSPGTDFAVLQPGQTFESKIDTGVIVQYENPKNFAGSIRSGVHVLQLELSAWNHPGQASEFAKSWRGVGRLVSGLIKTEPLEIRIPPNPQVEMDCK